MIPENLSSEVVGVSFYEQFLRPYHETWTSRIRAAGKISCIHLDGTLRGLLGRVASAGFDLHRGHDPGPRGRRARGRMGRRSRARAGPFCGADFPASISPP